MANEARTFHKPSDCRDEFGRIISNAGEDSTHGGWDLQYHDNVDLTRATLDNPSEQLVAALLENHWWEATNARAEWG
ncbi:MAG TPA: hypothetical protein VGW38_25060 [Chloroflexota bacterium]|nr:hypothetical protein [Chloroflexota bacterium]